MADLIAERLRTLRGEKRLSVSKLSRLTVEAGYAGVPENTIKAIERYPGRVPEAEILEALARALHVDPKGFYEYPIAIARREARARAAQKRLASELQQEGQRQGAHREDEPGAMDA